MQGLSLNEAAIMSKGLLPPSRRFTRTPPRASNRFNTNAFPRASRSHATMHPSLVADKHARSVKPLHLLKPNIIANVCACVLILWQSRNHEISLILVKNKNANLQRERWTVERVSEGPVAFPPLFHEAASGVGQPRRHPVRATCDLVQHST